MTDNPFLSIITLAYQDPDGLEKTAASLTPFAQSFSESFEWLVVDGSPAAHQKILKKAIQLQPYLKHIVDQPEGIYPAMNRGIEQSKGQVLWFLNSGDELIDLEALQEGLTFIKKEKAEIVVMGAKLFRDGKFLNPVFPSSTMENNLLGVNRICHQATLAHRRTFEFAKFSTDYRLISDYIHLFQAWQSGVAIRVHPKLLVAYDMGGASSKWKEALKEFGIYARKNLTSPMGRRSWMAFKAESIRIHATKVLMEGPFKSWIDPVVRRIKQHRARPKQDRHKKI